MTNLKKISIIVMILIFTISLSACGIDLGNIFNNNTTTFNVVYHGNQNTSGEVVTDDNDYNSGDVVTVKDNDNNLARTGYIFDGWNNQEDGQGTDYAADSTFTITAPVILYAKWVLEGQQIERFATLKKVYLKPVTLAAYSTNPSYDVGYWGNVKLDAFKFTFGTTGYETPNYVFEDLYPLQQGVAYTIDDVTFVDIPVGTYKEFIINSNANYFKKMISTTNTLSFKAGLAIHNFAKPTYTNGIISPFARTGGSLINPDAHTDVNVPIDATTLTVESLGLSLPVAGFSAFDVQYFFDITKGHIPEEEHYNVTYDGNGTTTNVPIDNINYVYNSTVTVAEQGNMTYEGYIFEGWNTASDGSGTAYSPDDTFLITNDTVLYAQWAPKATANLLSKVIKSAVLSGSTYDAGNVTSLIADIEYGTMNYLYINVNDNPTLSIAQFLYHTINPSSTEVTVIYKKNNVVTGYNDVFNVPTTTNTQVAISIEIRQGDELLDACMIYIRKIP